MGDFYIVYLFVWMVICIQMTSEQTADSLNSYLRHLLLWTHPDMVSDKHLNTQYHTNATSYPRQSHFLWPSVWFSNYIFGWISSIYLLSTVHTINCATLASRAHAQTMFCLFWNSNVLFASYLMCGKWYSMKRKTNLG